jgi:hypothetical protein
MHLFLFSWFLVSCVFLFNKNQTCEYETSITPLKMPKISRMSMYTEKSNDLLSHVPNVQTPGCFVNKRARGHCGPHVVIVLITSSQLKFS